jgi:protein TonB
MLAKPRALARHWSTRIDAKLDAVAALPPPPVFLTVEKALSVSVPMQTAACVSFAFHLFVVLGVGLAGIDPDRFAPPHNVMDVVLVNSKSASKPLKADALAQANLDGGGNTDEKRRAKTPLPAIEQQAARNAEQAQERVRQLEQEMKTLMTQARAQAKVLQGEANQKPSGSPDPVSPSDLLQKSIEIARLEAQISREYDAYQQRPKRKFIGARTSEYRFAQYVDNWRTKVERIGNLNYPEQARSRKIYGSLQLTVAIKANGEIEDVQINRSSGYKVLDDAAKRIIRLAAPFDRFPDNIRRDTDILHITRTWMFTKGDLLSSE